MRKRKKKQALTLNGRRRVHIQTRHGEFAFTEQQFLDAERQATSYLRQTGQAAVSAGLEEFCLFCCTRASYDTVVSLVERLCGRALVCPQTLCHWVERKAQAIDGLLRAEVAAAQSLPPPLLAETTDLYDPAAEEVLVLCDGICVKAQKPTHEKEGQPKGAKPDKRHQTDVFLCEGRDGSFRYLAGSHDKTVSLVTAVGAHLRAEWGQRETPLPVVALTDGAKTIRQDLSSLFGSCVTIILDWYHLAKRVYEHLSMMAYSKAERETAERDVLGLLWRGQVTEAIAFVATFCARNKKAQAELVGYLQKHESEIIHYERRAATRKPIGSGRMEKAVDQVVGMRQKKKGMSWSAAGSHALALLKIAELNGQWQQLWQQPACLA